MYCPEGDLGDGGLIVGNDRAIAGEVGHAMDVECNLCCQHDLSKLCVIYGGHRWRAHVLDSFVTNAP